MPLDQLIALASLGGFVFASVVLLLILARLFDAIRHGELVAKGSHDELVKRLADENAALRQDNRDSVRELARVAAAIERLANKR